MILADRPAAAGGGPVGNQRRGRQRRRRGRHRNPRFARLTRRTNRAAKDVIQKINDQPIHTIAELRKALIEHPKGLIVEVSRDGKIVKLQEDASGK